MVAEITQSKFLSTSGVVSKKSNGVASGFAETFQEKIEKFQKNLTNVEPNESDIVNKDSSAQNVFHSSLLPGIGFDPQVEEEKIEKLKMQMDYMQMMSKVLETKYPYGCVITTDDYGTVTSIRAYRKDGSCYMDDVSNFPNILTQKDFKAIAAAMSKEDKKKYLAAGTDSLQFFVDELNKLDNEGKFDDNKSLHNKLSSVRNDYDSYLAELKKEQEEKI